MNDKILSVVIPARNEFPNIIHTVHNILSTWEADGFDYRDLEIIIVDNCSTDDKFPQRGSGGTTSYMFGRGAYYNRVIRVIYDPLAGNHSARNKGARVARGEYVYFSDAHMSLAPGFFKHMLKTCKESGGLVHGQLQFMGAYPPTDRGAGFQYTIKLGEEIKGTWAPYKVSDDWFYIAAQGHWGLMANREQFLNFGGYPEIHRCYGGGEFYTDMKWWLYGSCVVCEPKSIGYHLAAGRGYSYNHDDYIHNVMNIGVALGMDDWVERMYINCLRRGNKQVLDRMLEEAYKEADPDRKVIESRRVKTFNELLVERPWDKMNQEKHGYHFSGLTIFHDTIIELFKQSPVAWEAYQNSKHQAELDKFINENLSSFVYGRAGVPKDSDS
jgi:glycosyltransferase involved in cell wall biosynthesis